MEHFSNVSKDEEEAAASKLTGTHYAIRQEIYDLYARTLLRNENESGEGKLVLPHHFHYEEARVTQMGRVAYSMMSLVEIDRDDLDILASLMRQHPRYR